MKCQFYFLSYVNAILVVWRSIQRNFLMLTFMSKCFLKYLWQSETQLSIFWQNNSLNSKIFISRPPCFLEVMVFNIYSNLTFQFIRIFQRNENRFVSLVLKAKQQKPIQMPCSFLKFCINQSSKQLLLFLIFRVYET